MRFLIVEVDKCCPLNTSVKYIESTDENQVIRDFLKKYELGDEDIEKNILSHWKWEECNGWTHDGGEVWFMIKNVDNITH